LKAAAGGATVANNDLSLTIPALTRIKIENVYKFIIPIEIAFLALYTFIFLLLLLLLPLG
jgi:hypothetical protein